MKDLIEILERIRKTRDMYDSCKLSLIPEQSLILRDLSVSYADLDDHRIAAKERWNEEYFKSEGSNAARAKEADKKVPEMYKIRRIMDSTNILIKSVVSTLSSAKINQISN